MVRRWVGVLVGLLSCSVAQTVRAEEARHGVTGDVSLGIGAAQTSRFWGGFNGMSFFAFQSDDMEFAVMLPELSLGAWISPKASLGGRVSSFWYIPEDQDVVGGFVGLELRYLPLPHLLLAAAPGVLLAGKTFEGRAKAGFGGDLRLAWLPLVEPDFSFGFFGETAPGVVDGNFTYSAGGGLVLAR